MLGQPLISKVSWTASGTRAPFTRGEGRGNWWGTAEPYFWEVDGWETQAALPGTCRVGFILLAKASHRVCREKTCNPPGWAIQFISHLGLSISTSRLQRRLKIQRPEALHEFYIQIRLTWGHPFALCTARWVQWLAAFSSSGKMLLFCPGSTSRKVLDSLWDFSKILILLSRHWRELAVTLNTRAAPLLSLHC